MYLSISAKRSFISSTEGTRGEWTIKKAIDSVLVAPVSLC
jgi:hypothetical protein